LQGRVLNREWESDLRSSYPLSFNGPKVTHPQRLYEKHPQIKI
jgi:hypothetical protein